jgi:hypothetical protein
MSVPMFVGKTESGASKEKEKEQEDSWRALHVEITP